MQVQSIQHYNSNLTKQKKHKDNVTSPSFCGAENLPKETAKEVVKTCGSEIASSVVKTGKKLAGILSEKLAKLAEESPKK